MVVTLQLLKPLWTKLIGRMYPEQTNKLLPWPSFEGFTRMNPPTLYGSKIKEDPKEFIDKIYKILYTMG